MNKRQIKKLSKIAMKAINDFDNCSANDWVGAVFILAEKYANISVTSEFNDESMVVICHYPSINHLSVGKKIHFMANYLKGASR